MIAGEEKLISIEQDHVSARVAWNRYREQVTIERHRIIAPNYLFDTKPSGAIVGMHHALAAKCSREPRMIGNVIAMRQKHFAHAAHRGDPLDKLRGEAR